MSSHALSIRGLAVSYGGATVLEGISLSLAPGEALALLGASGCGKTTLLRMIAGLLAPDAGEIEIAGRTVAAPARGIMAPPEKRGLGMVFQDYALWPHLSVARNVAFPLEMAKTPRAEREARVMRALDRVGLSAFAERRPSDLSGGQQQRVAIARAIVAAPPLVLFDEPLSNLDRDLRETMVEEIADLIRDLGLSAVYVTHDHAEALSLAHRVAILRGGGIEQLASPEELVEAPASVAAAEFLRLGPVFSLREVDGLWRIDGTGPALPPPPARFGPFPRALLPERALRLSDDGPARLPAEVLRVQPRAGGRLVSLRIEGTGATLKLLSSFPVAPGARVTLSFSPDALRWFPGAA